MAADEGEMGSRTSGAIRIQKISTIDEAVPQLLSSASAAVNALSDSVPKANLPSTGGQASALETHKELFTASTEAFFTVVKKIGEQLRDEAALIEAAMPTAGIDNAEATDASRDANKDEQTGLGSLDVGWLKSRLNGGESDMEGKVWAEARSLLEAETKKS